jgi:hypothetical protein
MNKSRHLADVAPLVLGFDRVKGLVRPLTIVKINEHIKFLIFSERRLSE